MAGVCSNARFGWRRCGAARLQESFYLISSRGGQIPTQKKKKIESHCFSQPGVVKFGLKGRGKREQERERARERETALHHSIS